MRTSILSLLAAGCGLAAALPAPESLIPVYTPEEVEARGLDAAAACFLTAYANTGCTGSAGQNFGANTCATLASTRNSLLISPGCPTLNVYYYHVGGCSGPTPTIVTLGPGCSNFNTGFIVESILSRVAS